MAFFYHGTSLDIGREIQAHGFCSQNKDLIWNCSDPDSTYFYNDEVDGNEHEGFYRALESAQISAAFHNSQVASVAVVTLEVPEGSQLENWIEPDESCRGMDSYAVSIDDEAIHRAVKAGTATIHVTFHDYVYDPGFRYLYLANLDIDLLKVDAFTVQAQQSLMLAKRLMSCEIFETLIGEPISCVDLPEFIDQEELADCA